MNDDDRLVFFANSADKPVGRGVGEKVAQPKEYATLQSIPHWRRIFSSLWTSDAHPLRWRGRTFRSHSHAYQAAKFEEAGAPDAASEFCIESGSWLGTQGTGLDAHKARRVVKLTPEQLAVWASREDVCKEEIYRAKYMAEDDDDALPRRALLATGRAELWNQGPRIKTRRCVRLEKIRDELIHSSVGIERSPGAENP